MSLIFSRRKEEASAEAKMKYDQFSDIWKINERIEATEIVKNMDVFFFDCDGVIWHGNSVVEGAVEVIKKLIEKKKKIFFITNNSTKSRNSFLTKFHNLGFTFVTLENIICTAYAVAKYMHDQEIFASRKKKIYVIGGKGICDEMDFFQLDWIGGEKDDNQKISMHDGLKIEADRNIGGVVVGMDFNINYYKIQYAQLCINELDAQFVATNKDALGNFTSTQIWAGTGSIVSSIESAVTKKPIILGKPNTYMIDHLLKQLNVDKSKVIMVGDRLDTDIHFAKNCNIASLLVSTGVTNSHVYLNQNPMAIKPDYIMPDITDLF